MPAIPDDDAAVAVYRLPGLTAVTEPETPHGISGQRLKKEIGVAQFTITQDDPAHALIEPGIDVMAFRRDGKTVHSCVVEEIDEHTIDTLGGARQIATYKGRGAGVVLDWCPIFPAGGAGRKPIEDDAVFDWRSLRYDKANHSWVPATEIMTVLDAEAGGWPHQPMADEFDLTTGAKMILSSAGTDTSAPDGWFLFLYDLTVDPSFAGRWAIELLMDDLGLFWVDGIQQLDVPHTDGFVTASFKRIILSSGVHRFAWAVRNAEDPEDPGEGLGPAALAFNLYKADLQDRPLAGGPYIVSDDNVDVLQVEDGDWPTMVVGDILHSLWEEAIDLGFTVDHLEPSFTRTHDSNGDPWAQIGTGSEGGITTKTGTTTIMGLLIEMQAAAHVAQWQVQPDAVTWDVYRPGYTNRPTPTGFPGGVELEPAPVGDPRTGQILMLDRRRT